MTVEELQAETAQLGREIGAVLRSWCAEPITRAPFNGQRARDAAASAAWNDSHQELTRVLG